MIGEDYFSELPTPGVLRLGLVLENDGLFPENIIVVVIYIYKKKHVDHVAHGCFINYWYHTH